MVRVDMLLLGWPVPPFPVADWGTYKRVGHNAVQLVFSSAARVSCLCIEIIRVSLLVVFGGVGWSLPDFVSLEN